MRIRIHRGTREIGGTCIELESAASRILLDLGLPLDVADPASAPLPGVDGLGDGSSGLLAIVLSHGHRDHWGLVPRASPQIPLVMGRATESIMRAAADFVPDAVVLNAASWPPSSLRHTLPPVPSDQALYSLTLDIRTAAPAAPDRQSFAKPTTVIEAFSPDPLGTDLVGKEVTAMLRLAGDTRGVRWWVSELKVVP